jgi:hypothetical protein
MSVFTHILLSVALLGSPVAGNVSPQGVQETMEKLEIKVTLDEEGTGHPSAADKAAIRAGLAKELLFQFEQDEERKVVVEVQFGEEQVLEISDPSMKRDLLVIVGAYIMNEWTDEDVDEDYD